MSPKGYVSNLTDEEWVLLHPLVQRQCDRGRTSLWPTRQILNTIFYVLRGGIAWRALPVNFPPWQTVYYHFQIMRQEGVWEGINAQLKARYRAGIGRSSDAHAAIIDSQSAKATECRSERSMVI